MSSEGATTEASFSKVLPAGRYSFEIGNIGYKISGGGKKYINLDLVESNGKGKVYYSIYASADYDSHENQAWAQGQWNALKRLFMVSGITPPAKEPTATDLQNLRGTFIDADITIEDYTDKNGKPKQSNQVSDCYPFSGVKPDISAVTVATDTTNMPDNDDVPFF